MFTGQKSIITRVMLAFIFCLSITPVILMVYINVEVRDNLLGQQRGESISRIQDQQREISFIFDGVIDDLRLVQEMPSVAQFLATPDTPSRTTVEASFRSFVTTQKIYDQVRLIHANGMELVRVDQGNNRLAEAITEDDLQDKSDRHYVIAGLELEAGDIYISELDLNQENGIIEEPYTPVVRIVTPIYDNQTLQALLVFNVLTDSIFDTVANINPDGTYYVVNQRGDIMYTNSSDATAILYATDLGLDTNFSDVLPLTLPRVTTADALIDNQNDNFYVYTPLHLTSEGTTSRTWYIISSKPLTAILEPVNQTVNSIILITLFGLLISVIASFMVSWTITRPIRLLKTATVKLKERNWQESVKLVKMINRNDEIGTLATTFEEMLQEIRNQYGVMEMRVRERTIELEWANNQLQELDRVKTQFVENIAHDIHSPLSSILLAITSLERYPDRTEQITGRVLKRIQKVQDLLDKFNALSQLDETNIKPATSDVNLAVLFQSILDVYEDTVHSFGLAIQVEINPVPDISGNQFLLEQLFENILSNAIKYTLEGIICVQLYEDTGQIILKITDSGIGIPQDEIPMVTRRYYRAENAKVSDIIGTGIGLGIVKETAERHHGQVAITSTVGKGTTVTITLPIQPPVADV